MKYASPQLESALNLDLAVPGTYFTGFHFQKKSNSNQHSTGDDKKSITKITRFDPTLPIIPSKQRPRKMGVISESGQMFRFLLKGNEDLRQDERVMQLFGLINNLLQNNQVTHFSTLFEHSSRVDTNSIENGKISLIDSKILCDTTFPNYWVDWMGPTMRYFKRINFPLSTKSCQSSTNSTRLIHLKKMFCIHVF